MVGITGIVWNSESRNEGQSELILSIDKDRPQIAMDIGCTHAPLDVHARGKVQSRLYLNRS